MQYKLFFNGKILSNSIADKNGDNVHNITAVISMALQKLIFFNVFIYTIMQYLVQWLLLALTETLEV